MHKDRRHIGIRYWANIECQYRANIRLRYRANNAQRYHFNIGPMTADIGQISRRL